MLTDGSIQEKAEPVSEWHAEMERIGNSFETISEQLAQLINKLNQ